MSTKAHFVRETAPFRVIDRVDFYGWKYRAICAVCRRKGWKTFMGYLRPTAHGGFEWHRLTRRMGATERRQMSVFNVYFRYTEGGKQRGRMDIREVSFGRLGRAETLTEADMPLRVRCQSGHHLNVLDVGAMFDLIDEADAAGRREVVIPE